MSFFSRPNTAGNAFEIIGILEIIAGIFAIIDGFIDEEIDTGFAVVLGVGAIICGLIIAFFGTKVRKGIISEKIDILATFVRIVGVTTIISGLFLVIAEVIPRSRPSVRGAHCDCHDHNRSHHHLHFDEDQ